MNTPEANTIYKAYQTLTVLLRVAQANENGSRYCQKLIDAENACYEVWQSLNDRYHAQAEQKENPTNE